MKPYGTEHRRKIPMSECMYPQLAPSTSHHKGCRCFRCFSYHSSYMKQWRRKNKKHCQSYERKKERRSAADSRKASRRQKMKTILSVEEKNEIDLLYKKCRELTETTGISHHVDHIIPLAKGGHHHPSNLQILTAEENLKKGTSSPSLPHEQASFRRAYSCKQGGESHHPKAEVLQ